MLFPIETQVIHDLAVVGNESVQEAACEEPDSSAARQDEAGDHAGKALVGLIAAQVEEDLGAHEALDAEDGHENGAGRSGGRFVHRIQKHAESREK